LSPRHIHQHNRRPGWRFFYS